MQSQPLVSGAIGNPDQYISDLSLNGLQPSYPHMLQPHMSLGVTHNSQHQPIDLQHPYFDQRQTFQPSNMPLHMPQLQQRKPVSIVGGILSKLSDLGDNARDRREQHWETAREVARHVNGNIRHVTDTAGGLSNAFLERAKGDIGTLGVLAEKLHRGHREVIDDVKRNVGRGIENIEQRFDTRRREIGGLIAGTPSLSNVLEYAPTREQLLQAAGTYGQFGSSSIRSMLPVPTIVSIPARNRLRTTLLPERN